MHCERYTFLNGKPSYWGIRLLATFGMKENYTEANYQLKQEGIFEGNLIGGGPKFFWTIICWNHKFHYRIHPAYIYENNGPFSLLCLSNRSENVPIQHLLSIGYIATSLLVCKWRAAPKVI